jgi:hypothetical protein
MLWLMLLAPIICLPIVSFFQIYHVCNTNQKENMFRKKRYGNPILLQMMSGKGTQFLNPI